MSYTTTITSEESETVLGILLYADWNPKEIFFISSADGGEEYTATLADAVKVIKTKTGETVPVKAQEALMYEFASAVAKGFKV